MPPRPSTLERAFELANSGHYGNISEIRHQLNSEGYHDATTQLYGRSLASQLRKICLAAKAARAADQ
jgi:hypothetical protein